LDQFIRQSIQVFLLPMQLKRKQEKRHWLSKAKMSKSKIGWLFTINIGPSIIFLLIINCLLF